MLSWLEEKNLGTRKINYKLRDWLFSRQRYWGEPFPVINTKDGPKLVQESELPVLLPEIEKYQPTTDGEPPLARAKDWLKYKDPKTGEEYLRETNTMPQWAGSCWYYLRYLDPKNDKAAWDKDKENYWMPVDLYIGGVEHAVLHLLYSRFWHHVLHDLGLVSCREPFKKLVNQGMILGEDNQKMSKSRGNVINPDEIVNKEGADTLRMYEMFMGPLEQVKPWNTKSVGGVYRFLNRSWNLLIDEKGESKVLEQEKPELTKSLHRTVKKVTEELEQLKFNTAIAALMSFLNEAYDSGGITKDSAKIFTLLLSPFAPHMSEELWEKLGSNKTLAYETWPKWDESLVKLDKITIAIQVNGKVRNTLNVSAEISKEELLELAKADEKISKQLEGKNIIKEIVVPKRLVNIVCKG